jgi:hypothetical protein
MGDEEGLELLDEEGKLRRASINAALSEPRGDTASSAHSAPGAHDPERACAASTVAASDGSVGGSGSGGGSSGSVGGVGGGGGGGGGGGVSDGGSDGSSRPSIAATAEAGGALATGKGWPSRRLPPQTRYFIIKSFCARDLKISMQRCVRVSAKLEDATGATFTSHASPRSVEPAHTPALAR